MQSPLINNSPLFGLLAIAFAITATTATAQEKAPLQFSGGHEISKDDFGRPVVLIAAALGVKPEDFRKAFSGVTPVKGHGPTGDEARKNKEALLKVLSPLGVTNERLDEVSDYYRYRPQNGELWKNRPAKGYAEIKAGKVKKIVITDAGSGYSSPPNVAIKGYEELKLKAKLHFDRDLKKNGAIDSVEIAK